MGVTSYRNRDGARLWQVDVRVVLRSGKEKRILKRKIPTKEQALAYEQKLRAEAFEGKNFERSRSTRLTVRQAWESYEPISKRDQRSWKSTEGRAAHLVRLLGSRRVEALTLRDIDKYRAERAKEPGRAGDHPAVSTVNREVGLLRHMLNHAVKCGDLDRNPLAGVKMLDEDNVREVVIGEAEFVKLHGCAEPALKPILLVAYDTGMRKREILDLRWDQVNLEEGTIRLAARDTKSKKPRIIVLTTRLRDMLKEMRETAPRSISGYVFVNPETDKPWNQVKKVFDRARKDAGLPELWFHDLRRSFVTNARRRGVAESVVMRMSGHRTRSVFDRYNIIDEEDLRSAVVRLEEGRVAETAGERAAQ